MNIVETTQSVNPMIETETQTQIESNKIIKQNKNINSTEKNTDNPTESGTIISSIYFLKEQQIQNDINISNINNINNINNKIQSEKIPKDTTSTSTGTESNGSQNSEESNQNNVPKKTFAGKTKQWAGNVWNSIKNIKIFKKTEYEEFRNANGDIVKIPKKKLPLKKKKNINENVNNKIAQEHNKEVSTYDGVAKGLYIDIIS